MFNPTDYQHYTKPDQTADNFRRALDQKFRLVVESMKVSKEQNRRILHRKAELQNNKMRTAWLYWVDKMWEYE